tara:strand:+ start:75 stop:977 length:903 start_codon:yes stop_codon:yes gene_type:complete
MTDIAFIIPCFNEEDSISLVIKEIKELFPDSNIFVCDNNSKDNTREYALAAGAEVFYEKNKGKGNAVRRLLRDIDAEIYIMVDGDNTYNLTNLKKAVKEFKEGFYDLMTGDRFYRKGKSDFRRGHKIGNIIFTLFFKKLFGIKTKDVFSGLRIFSRRLVKSFPLVSSEFEIETELSIYASRMRLPCKDFPTSVVSRANSSSKLSTYKDGLKILFFSMRLLHREFPLKLYWPLCIFSAFISIYLFSIPFSEYNLSGNVTKIPTLITSTIFFTFSIFSFFAGLTLQEISNLKYEQRYLKYLK